MKPKLPNRKLCYEDTDSLLYLIKTDDFFKDISTDIDQWFDTNCSTKSKAGIPLTIVKKIPGLIRNKAGEDEISHFVALRPKMYAF